MLVLTRREGEGIRIDGGIVVSIIEIKGDRVKIGIEAPHSTVVLRCEVPDDRENNR